MNDAAIFRPLLIIGLVGIFAITLYHRIRSWSTRESLDRRQEGTFILATLRPIALLHYFGAIAYLINPAWMAWSSVSVPAAGRWLGVALLAFDEIFLFWTLHSLGRNLTDTVVTRQVHTLVVHGPYRYVRHPFYVAIAILIASIALVTANWFLAVTGAIVMALLVLRTPREEAWLVVRFGDAYREYMRRTRRFLPRV